MNAVVDLPDNIEISLCFNCFAEPNPSKDEHFYYRRVNSADDMSDISCWVNNINIVDAFVFSWINLKYKKSNFKVSDDLFNRYWLPLVFSLILHISNSGYFQPFKLQCILVFAENEQTYAIRIFDEDLPSGQNTFIAFNGKKRGLANMKTASGKRIISNITTKYEELKDKQNC